MNVIDFRDINPRPFFITKPYGPAQPWPADRPANWITKPYGPAWLGQPDLSESTLVIPARGAPWMSDRYVLPDTYDGDLPTDQRFPSPPLPGNVSDAPPRALGGWLTDEWKDLKTFTDNHPTTIVAIWAGIVLIALRLINVAKG